MDGQCRNWPLSIREALKSSSPKKKNCFCQAMLLQPLSVAIKAKSGLRLLTATGSTVDFTSDGLV